MVRLVQRGGRGRREGTEAHLNGETEFQSVEGEGMLQCE